MCTLKHNVITFAAAGMLAVLVTIVFLLDPRQASADSSQNQPFQTTLCRFFGTNLCQSTPSSFSVPAEGRLVIEYVSGLCPPAGTSLSSPGENISGAILHTVVDGVQANHLLRITPGVAVGATGTVADLDLNGFVVAQITRIYADPGSQVTLDIAVGGLGDTSISCTLAISGHLEKP